MLIMYYTAEQPQYCSTLFIPNYPSKNNTGILNCFPTLGEQSYQHLYLKKSDIIFSL